MLKAVEATGPAYSQLGVSWRQWVHDNALASTVSITAIALYPKVTLLGFCPIQPRRHHRGGPFLYSRITPFTASHRCTTPAPEPSQA